jgi:AbrB family looped-hinge helix DNA binding protein
MTMHEIKEHIRTITAKGQVTIPVEIRRLLGVKPRDRIVFRIVEGKVELQPTTMTLEATFGAVKPRSRPEDFSALRDTAVEEHAQKVVEEMKA